MNQKDHSLLEKMNINSDAIVGNQCDENKIEEFNYKGHNIRYLSFAERGISLNRNNTLMRATADICLLSDDDVILDDDYVETISESFRTNPEADIIIFNLREEETTRFVIKKKMKINFFNYMRFGATRIAFRRKSIVRNGISFNLQFGNSEYGFGEDVLFLTEALKKGLKIIGLPRYIGRLSNAR